MLTDWTSDDTQRFIERMRTVLPQYRPHFLEAQIETGIDWDIYKELIREAIFENTR